MAVKVLPLSLYNSYMVRPRLIVTNIRVLLLIILRIFLENQKKNIPENKNFWKLLLKFIFDKVVIHIPYLKGLSTTKIIILLAFHIASTSNLLLLFF